MDDRILLLYQCMGYLNHTMMIEEEEEEEEQEGVKGIGTFNLLIPDALFYITKLMTSLIHYDPVRLENLDMDSLPVPKALTHPDGRFYSGFALQSGK